MVVVVMVLVLGGSHPGCAERQGNGGGEGRDRFQ
jgi:hypothetical protein